MEILTTNLQQLLAALSELFVPLIDLLALVLLVVGTIEAFVRGAALFFGNRSREKRREIWLRYSNWLVAGLTFQLAADIIETATAPSWDDLGRLAAIALIRTFLNYFLERDQSEVRTLIKEGTEAPGGEPTR